MMVSPSGASTIGSANIAIVAAPLAAHLGLERPARLQATLHALFDACQADMQCAAAFPNVEETFYGLVTALDATPITIDLVDPSTNTTRTRVVSGGRLVQLVEASLGDYDQLRRLPRVVTLLAQGHLEALHQIPGVAIAPATFQWGAFLATWCAEEAPFYTGDLLSHRRTPRS